MIYTAQYRYSGPGRLDITVKGQDPRGKLLAPTWDMVMGYKNGTLNEEQYTQMYFELMQIRFSQNPQLWMEIADSTEDIVLVCFCPAGVFCHRHLAAQILHSLGAQLGGEIHVGKNTSR